MLIDDSGSVDRAWRVVTPGGVSADVRVCGPGRVMTELAGTSFARFANGDVIDMADPHPPRRARLPGVDGRTTALRRSSPSVLSVEAPVLTAEVPDVPRDPVGFPAVVLITSAVTAALAALLFSPVFALLSGLSAVAAIARWLGSRLSVRRAGQRRVAAMASARRNLEQVRDRWAEAEAAGRRRSHDGPADLLAMVGGPRSPWSRRLGPDEPIGMVLGDGAIVLEVPTDRCTLPVDLVLSIGVRLIGVPIVADCGARDGLAVCGDRSEALAAARWLALSTITAIGPADLVVVLVTTADRARDWDWLKWVPSLAGCVITDLDQEDRLTVLLDRAGPELVIIDGAEPSRPGPLAKLLSGRQAGTRLLWIGDSVEVPAGCASRLEVAADGWGCLIDEQTRQSLRWHRLGEEEADVMARWLGGFDDPEVDAPSALLPASVVIAAVDRQRRPAAGTSERASATAAVVEQHWARATGRNLRATIGVGADGPFEVDLVVDGPHALVAGTTGAGKSELLRTLVVALAAEQPPDLVSFVLIDFKGGGAFDAVAPLPHVAAVVTDLDPSDAQRALRGLRAEVLDRERRLRDMEVSDVSDIDPSHHRAFGRLVVLVDEFATLAGELPDFLDGLVDIARRGRSLGVHLVLATQRPAGVVTGQIRANTNLRLCLRVQDRADSVDLVDRPDAANLPAIPGRAIVRRGGASCEDVQIAAVDGRVDELSVEPFVLHPCVGVSDEARRSLDDLGRLLGAGPVSEDQHRGRSGGDAESLIESIVRVGERLGLERSRPPWMPPLSTVDFPVSSTAEVGDRVDGHALLGLVDDPDRRSVLPLAWAPDADGLLIVGVDEKTIAATGTVAVCSLLDCPGRRPAPVLILDGSSAGTSALGALLDLEPVIDIVGASEPERLAKAVERLLVLPGPLTVVIHDWQAVAGAVGDQAGPAAVEGLIRLVRRGGTAGVSIVVTARSDRDVPQRAAAHLGRRLVHRLADPGGYLTFGLRAADVAELDGARFADPSSGLVGVIASVSDDARRELAGRLAGSGTGQDWPTSIRVLGERVDRADLPPVQVAGDGWRVPVGLDLDLAPHWIVVSPERPVVVLAHPEGGRTTTLATIAGALGDRVCLIDDADTLADAVLAEQAAEARRNGLPLLLSCVPSSARRFGSAIADVMAAATVVLLNPSRGEGEVVRVAVPDLSDHPVGRAVAVQRGRATVVQIAA